MITLFAKTGCPYCAKAIAKLDELGLSFEKRNIANDAVAEELVAIGGKRQVPYLIDGEVRMYESDEIVNYLQATYGKSDAHNEEKPLLTVHMAEGTSSVCNPTL